MACTLPVNHESFAYIFQYFEDESVAAGYRDTSTEISVTLCGSYYVVVYTLPVNHESFAYIFQYLEDESLAVCY
jgi:hypothetical protein